MEKGLDHLAWSTPCGREINYYKLITSRFQFCLKFNLQKKNIEHINDFPPPFLNDIRLIPILACSQT